tara:strand:+ start:110 stop:676 length:567 start_codon:yes stop_codon:yes gene_type:complete
MANKLFLIFLFGIITSNVFAYSISTGTYVPYFNQVQTNNSGQTRKFELNPHIGIGTQIQMSAQHFFIPEFGFTYFLNNAENTKRDIIHLNYDFGYILNSNTILRYGLSNHWYRLHGQGGSVKLRNGTGSTEFPSPDKTVVTYYTTLDLGMEYIFPSRTYGLRFDFHVLSFQELENRSYNYLLTFNFYR